MRYALFERRACREVFWLLLPGPYTVTFRVLMVLILWLGAHGARGEDDPPIAFIRVAEAKRLADQGNKVLFVDVRSRQEYLARHIQEAVSVPLNVIPERFGEIPRQGLVVLY